MDAIQLQKNLEFVRSDTDWEVVNGAMPAGVAASVNVDTGSCNVASGRIFGDSHVAIHEILHAKGALKTNQQNELAKLFFRKFGSKKVSAMLYLLEELRVERLVKEKDYAMPPDRFQVADNLLAICISEIWSLKLSTKFSLKQLLLKKKAKRFSELIFSYEKLPTAPKEVADWMADALPKAFKALRPAFLERVFLWITDIFYKFLNWLRYFWWWLKTKFLKIISFLRNFGRKKNKDSKKPATPPDFKPIHNPLAPLSDSLNTLEQLKELSESLEEKEKKLFPTISKIEKTLSAYKNPYKDLTLILPPAHFPCPPGTAEMKIPAYITNALLSGLKNKEKRYARSGRRLVVSRLLANSPPFAKHFFRTQKILILLDFSGSMNAWLSPMLKVVARLSSNTDFDVMAYSADRKRFILHLIYSDKYFSHAVHYSEGNADCAAFFIVKHFQVDYDKVIIIGDMRFEGPAPISDNDLERESRMALRDLLKGNRSLILTPGEKPYTEKLMNSLKISSKYLRGFEDEKEFQEILESAIRET